MNKSQILTELAAKFYRIGAITVADPSQAGQEVRQQEGINWYLVGVYEQSGNVLLRRNISIYVADEGLSTEQAFYAEREPVTTLAQPAPADEWAGVNGEVVSQGKDYAIIKRFEIVFGAATEKKFLVKKELDRFVYYPFTESTIKPII